MKFICLTLLIISGATDSRSDVVGHPPVITVDGFDRSGGFHLQCESEGWSPEPDLEWLDSEGVSLSSETTETHRNADRFSVKHTIIVYHSGKIHCRVKLRHHMLETLINTTKHNQLQTENRRIKHELDKLLQSQKIPKGNATLDADSASCLCGPEDEKEVIHDNTAPLEASPGQELPN
ncbi:butyrophilin-like protein 3 isoform X3 [Pimephales promelas]|uniref:butyrophilin-like protein 3 isoform X3 n=1 Tax=Pimephales promelas TaxID=90988 RepID=UPI001955D6DF|nr:butyrophilin-like protein 3 isoform X3 [Pimephales promelas]